MVQLLGRWVAFTDAVVGILQSGIHGVPNISDSVCMRVPKFPNFRRLAMKRQIDTLIAKLYEGCADVYLPSPIVFRYVFNTNGTSNVRWVVFFAD